MEMFNMRGRNKSKQKKKEKRVCEALESSRILYKSWNQNKDFG